MSLSVFCAQIRDAEAIDMVSRSDEILRVQQQFLSSR